jgi:two-component system, NarL family, response regulator NreC
MRRKTRLLVIGEEGLLRDGLCAVLRHDEGVHVDAVYVNARDALSAGRDLHPEVIIMELPVAMKTGPQTIAHVKRHWPHAAVLVLATSRDAEAIEASRRAGADGYVLRNDPRRELFQAIEALAQRKHYISSSVLEPPAARAPGLAPQAVRERRDALLTTREQEVVTLIAEGYRTREMAQLLSLSHKTVERHRTNVMRKLGVRSATGVVAYALTHGYIGF